MKFLIRTLKKEEISAVASIYTEAFSQADIDKSWTQKKAEEFINWWFEHQPDLFFVATHKEQLIGGIVAGVKPWWNHNNLTDGELFIDPNFQRQGVGKELIKTLLEKAIRKYEIVEFESLVDKGDEFPLSWYRKLGMTETTLVHIAGKPKVILKKLN